MTDRDRFDIIKIINMYYKGATTKKEIAKEILKDIPITICMLVLLYFTFEGLWKFIFNLITGRTVIITN